MPHPQRDDSSRPEWHVLLAPLPAGAVPSRKPLAPPEVLAGPTGWAIAGWEQLSVDLTAGPSGLRHVLVVLDGTGTLLSASDAVLYRMGPDGGSAPPDPDAPVLIRQESIGGRFEPDGSFRGTRWLSVAQDPGGKDELDWDMTKSEPSVQDVERLRSLVAEMIHRAP